MPNIVEKKIHHNFPQVAYSLEEEVEAQFQRMY